MNSHRASCCLIASIWMLTSLAAAQSDDCSSATPITGFGAWAFDTTIATPGDTRATCTEDSFPPPNVWFQWTPTQDGDYDLFVCGASYDVVLSLFGPNCSDDEIACDDGFANGLSTCSGTIFDVLLELDGVIAGTPYLVQLSGWREDSVGSGVLQIEERFVPTPPANDECVNAQVISGTGPTFFNTFGATDSGVGPACSPNVESNDVWFEWTALVDGDHELFLCGQGTRATLSVYDACGGNLIACYDDPLIGTCGAHEKAFLHNLSAGSTFLVRADAPEFDGRLRIRTFEAIPGDLCSEAIPAPAGESDIPFSTVDATPGPLSACNSSFSADIWYSWTPTAPGYEFRVRNHFWGTLLSLREGCSGAELTCATSQLDLRLPVDVVPGTEYSIQVDGFNGGQGTGLLEIRERIGSTYCQSSPNSVSALGARIYSVGSESLADEDLRLTTVNVPNFQPGIFYYGANATQTAFGDGVRCVAGSTVRLPVDFASGLGILETVVSFPDHGGQFAALGSVRFQAWYRDPSAGGAGFNLSDAILIQFQP